MHPSCATGTNLTPVGRSAGSASVPSTSRWFALLGSGMQPPVVHGLRDEPADVRVHPPRPVEEDAPVGGDRGRPVEQVLEARVARPPRVDALHRLPELHLIAEQDEVAGARAHRDQVRDGDLARLVDEEVVERLVELGAREEPRRSGDELEIAGRHVLVRLDVLDERAVEAMCLRSR